MRRDFQVYNPYGTDSKDLPEIIEFTNAKIVITLSDTSFIIANYVIDNRRLPRHIDLEIPEMGNISGLSFILPAIYKIEGGILSLNIGVNKVRPRSFRLEGDQQLFVFELTKVPEIRLLRKVHSIVAQISTGTYFLRHGLGNVYHR